NGYLMINNVSLDAVQPVLEGTVFDQTYVHISYYGLIGVTGAASSKTSYLSLLPDGAFELSGITLGSLGATSDPSTHASPSVDTIQGTYHIQGNTITMTSLDGTENHYL